MMRLGIVMPVNLQERALLEYTREAVEHLRTKYDAVMYVICKLLDVWTPDELREDLMARFQGRVTVVNEPGVVQSVSGSWNQGARLAMADSASYIAFVANDTRLRDDCLDVLTAFGECTSADLWSGISYNDRPPIDPTDVTDGADFTCFMVRPSTLHTHGWFDPNFNPAYFEATD